jgi:hypothetical protein
MAMNADLHQFVREALARGLGRDAIRASLGQAGWKPEEIDAALQQWAETDFPVPVPRRMPYLSAQEAFLYLVLFVTLYVTAFNVGVLLFQFIERWLPDPAFTAASYGSDRFSREAVRGAAAALIIAFPVYLFLSALIGRLLAREPEKRGSKVRKWLTYITLFVAALVILGDLTFLVARLLSGELGPRFLAKTVAVFAIAGVVFGHYLVDLRREEAGVGRAARRSSLLARAAGAATLLVLAIGLFSAGSPRTARFEEIDRRRVTEIQQISNSVEGYYRERRELPGTLDSLLRFPSTYVESVQDPVTHRPYEYRTVDSTTYELCATFDGANPSDRRFAPGRPDSPGFWRHGRGHTCYTLVIPRSIVEARAR